MIFQKIHYFLLLMEQNDVLVFVKICSHSKISNSDNSNLHVMWIVTGLNSRYEKKNNEWILLTKLFIFKTKMFEQNLVDYKQNLPCIYLDSSIYFWLKSLCPPCHVTNTKWATIILSNRVNTAFDPCTSRCREMCFANCIWLGKKEREQGRRKVNKFRGMGGTRGVVK